MSEKKRFPPEQKKRGRDLWAGPPIDFVIKTGCFNERKKRGKILFVDIIPAMKHYPPFFPKTHTKNTGHWTRAGLTMFHQLLCFYHLTTKTWAGFLSSNDENMGRLTTKTWRERAERLFKQRERRMHRRDGGDGGMAWGIIVSSISESSFLSLLSNDEDNNDAFVVVVRTSPQLILHQSLFLIPIPIRPTLLRRQSAFPALSRRQSFLQAVDIQSIHVSTAAKIVNTHASQSFCHPLSN